MSLKILKTIMGASVGICFLVGAGTAFSHSTGIPEADARIEKMKELGSNMKAIAAVAKGEVPYSASLSKNADAIAKIAEKMDTLFPEGSGGDKTRSKPEVWTQQDQFTLAIIRFKGAAVILQQAVITGDRGVIGQALGITGKSCGECHKPFRSPKDH